MYYALGLYAGFCLVPFVLLATVEWTWKIRFTDTAFYIGMFYSKRWNKLYIHPLPFIGFEFNLNKNQYTYDLYLDEEPN